ncbi:MAG: DHHA1 domain-containing protein [bacterium]|nr:DHHA1 domain-containing protein [bacterium]
MTFPDSELRTLREALREARVLISTHIHPDADAVGSVLAASEIVHGLGGSARIVLADDVPCRCRILPGAERVEKYASRLAAEPVSFAFIADSGSLDRLGDVRHLIAGDALIVNADHHLSNDRFGRINWVGVEFASTTELLFELCRALNVPMTPALADNLFAGLLSDTGRFRYSNTTAQSLAVASELIAAGARVMEITDGLYYDVLPADVRSLGEIYSTLELYGDGKISIMFVRINQLVEDPDSLVDLAASLRGVRVAALLSETGTDRIRVSLRSRDTINVARIAESFGGGGHAKAAGFRMIGTLESVRDRLLLELVAATRTEA